MKIKNSKFMIYPKLVLKISVLFIAVISILGFEKLSEENSKTGKNLSAYLNYISNSDNSYNSNEEILIWIYFSDKGINSNDTFDNEIKIKKHLTEKSIERRLKRIKDGKKFDLTDIPVNADYIREITDLGIKIKQKSKWFNAVSCYVNKNQIENITQKSFVKTVDLVLKYKKLIENENENVYLKDNYVNKFSDNNFTGNGFNNLNSENYGPSYSQDTLINVPAAHNKGYTGQGILIASFDAGFDNLSHPCFSRAVSKGLRTYDFVNGDTIVANGSGRMGEGSHGTLTLSLVGGYDPGNLISPAFDSKFILAKTENTDSETPLEEDNWVAAAEWADSLGADVITSSLGYLSYQAPYTSYTWESMNGQTALITRAADIAVSKGIVVVISAGNSGNNNLHNTLSAPADAFNVITVGSVNLNGQRSVFSSVGPTYDGRIKPEVMAMGSNNYCARPGNGNSGYTSTSSGTSLACPMTAGVCAMILSANGNLTPAEVKEILKSTSSNNISPNSLIGWGTIDALSAITKATENQNNITNDYQLYQNYPNPFNPETKIKYEIPQNGQDVKLKIYNLLGKEVTTLVNENKSAGSYEVKFNAANISSGVYFYTLYVNGDFIDSKKMLVIK